MPKRSRDSIRVRLFEERCSDGLSFRFCSGAVVPRGARSLDVGGCRDASGYLRYLLCLDPRLGRELLESKDRSATNREAWKAAPSAEPGDTVAEHPIVGQCYVILAKIGQGGMGQVFRALDRRTGQIVALKRVFLSPAARPSRVRESRWVSSAQTVITHSALPV